MKILIVCFTSIFTLQILACSSVERTLANHQDHKPLIELPVGGRSGLHGMVIFGHGPYFIEHIPMLQSPHDFQIVAEVVIRDKLGQVVLSPDLSNQTYTLKPHTHFSLNNLIQGELKFFAGAIYRNSFEQNGKLMADLQDVQIEVKKINLARQLPAHSTKITFEVKDQLYTYQTQIITPENSVQKIKNISTNETLWCVRGPDFFNFCP